MHILCVAIRGIVIFRSEQRDTNSYSRICSTRQILGTLMSCSPKKVTRSIAHNRYVYNFSCGGTELRENVYTLILGWDVKKVMINQTIPQTMLFQLYLCVFYFSWSTMSQQYTFTLLLCCTCTLIASSLTDGPNILKTFARFGCYRDHESPILW